MPTPKPELLAPIVFLWSAGLLWCGAASGQIVTRHRTGINLPPVVWAEIAAILPEKGPQVSFDIPGADCSLGFVARGWPIVVDFKLEEDGFLMLSIRTENDREDFYIKGRRDRREIKKLKVPKDFAKRVAAGRFIVTAFEKTKARGDRVDFQLYGIGVGKRAVGSLAIEQLEFGPGPIRTAEAQTAPYSFYAREDFDRTLVEIFNQRWDPDAGMITTAVTSEAITCQRKYSCTDRWNGMDAEGLPSPGQHLMQVRAWFSGPKNQKEWTLVRSPDRVEVDPP